MRKGNISEWLNGTHEYGKLSYSDNFYFEGNCIYSYGRHFTIAKIFREEKIILFSTRTYSNTTSKHQCAASSMIPSTYKILYVENAGADSGTNLRFFRDEIKRLKEIKGRGRAQEYRKQQIKQLQLLFKNYKLFLTGRGEDIKRLITEDVENPRRCFNTITRERVAALGACKDGRDTLDIFLRRMKKDEVTLEELFKSVSKETFTKYLAFARWLISYFEVPERLKRQIRKHFQILKTKRKWPLLSKINYNYASTQYVNHGYILENIYELVTGQTTVRKVLENAGKEKA